MSNAQRRPPVLAGGGEPLIELGHGRARVGLATRAVAQFNERVGLLGAGGEDAARPVIFERAPHETHAVRQQRRGQRVAGIPAIGLAVEGERQRARAVDEPAARQAKARGLLRRWHQVASSGRRSQMPPRDRVRARVALNDEPAPAARAVVPELFVGASRIIAQIDVLVERLRRPGALGSGRARPPAPRKPNSSASRSPQ